MALLSVANLEWSVGDRLLLDGVNLTLEAGEHVGVVGRNGTGKSSLMKLIAGLEGLKHDAGQIQVARSASVGYLHQDHKLDPERTCREEAATAMAHLAQLHERMEQLTHAMAEAEGEQLEKYLRAYERLEHRIEIAGGYAADHQMDATLHGVGLDDPFFNVKVRDLSGGQKGRLALAKLLLSQPDLLLLDEPTNHLDIAGREWLEDYLQQYSGAVLMISHDRWLLDRVVTKIYELEDGRLIEYPGNYQKYRELRAEWLLTQQRAYEKQQVKIRHEQGFIDRYRAGQRAKQAKGREKRLERFKQDVIDKPVESKTMNLQFEPAKRSGDVVLGIDGVSKRYDEKVLFEKLSFTLKRGDRIGIIGPNGSGKSTLVRVMLEQQEPDRGRVRLGSNVSVGHYAQTHEHLNDSLSVIDYLRKYAGLDAGRSDQSARDLAGAFLFSGDDQDKHLGVLSGGERSRCVLASIVAGRHNLLVLDEPTNHLDIPSAERLEESLKSYCKIGQRKREQAGTLVLITHDRMLLEDLVDQLLVFDGHGNVRHYIGTYSEWLSEQQQQRDAEAARREAETKAAARKREKAAPQAAPNKKQPSPGGAVTKLSQTKLETELAEIEASLQDVDGQLADPQVYRDGDRVRDLQQLRKQLQAKLEPLEEEWLRRADAAEQPG